MLNMSSKCIEYGLEDQMNMYYEKIYDEWRTNKGVFQIKNNNILGKGKKFILPPPVSLLSERTENLAKSIKLNRAQESRNKNFSRVLEELKHTRLFQNVNGIFNSWNSLSESIETNFEIPIKIEIEKGIVKTRYCNSVINNNKCFRKECSFAHNKEEIKPEICKFNKKCKKNNCYFIHSYEDIDGYTKRLGIFNAEKDEKIKLFCKYYKKCLKPDCGYAHSYNEYNPKKCDRDDKCTKNDCRFFHPYFENKEQHFKRTSY